MGKQYLSRVFANVAVLGGGLTVMAAGYDAFGVNIAEAASGILQFMQGGTAQIPNTFSTWMQFFGDSAAQIGRLAAGQGLVPDYLPSYATKLITCALAFGAAASGVTASILARGSNQHVSATPPASYPTKVYMPRPESARRYRR